MRVTIKDAYGQVEPARKSRLWLHFVMKIQTLLLLLTFITSAALASMYKIWQKDYEIRNQMKLLNHVFFCYILEGVEEQDSASPDQFSIDTQDNAGKRIATLE